MERTLQDYFTSEEPIKWLFTGDSITHGALHTYGSRDYVQIFEERLRYEIGRGRDFVLKTGVSGWRSTEILSDIEWNILQFDAQVVSIMVGMNDAALGCENLDSFSNNCNQILDLIQAKNKALVILHTPQPIVAGGEPTREPALPYIAERVREISRERGLMLVDHYEYWSKAWEENAIRMLQWTNDAIHPSNFGHQVMAKLLFEKLGIWDDKSICCGLLSR